MLSASSHRCRIAIAVAVAGAAAVQPAARGGELVANPVFTHQLPPPGWIGDHRPDWLAQHQVYQSRCRSPEVTGEIRYLNRVIGRDEYLLSLTTTPDPANRAAEHEAKLARQDLPTLRRDVAAADALVAQLEALPPCGAAAAAPQPPAPEAPPPPPAATPERFTVRFDDRVAALTPASIAAFNRAIAAARAGQKVQIVIDGCEAADFSTNSVCTRRRYSLENRLADAGVKDPPSLFPDLPSRR
jgi:hypothetical protein